MVREAYLSVAPGRATRPHRPLRVESTASSIVPCLRIDMVFSFRLFGFVCLLACVSFFRGCRRPSVLSGFVDFVFCLFGFFFCHYLL